MTAVADGPTRWWAGHRFGIVPAACVAAIVATAADVDNVSAPTAVAVFTALAIEAQPDGSGSAQASAAHLLGMAAGSVRRAVANVLEPAGVVTRDGRGGLVLHLPSEAAEARHSARRSAPPSAPQRATQRAAARHPARPPYTEGAETTDLQTPVAPSSQLALVGGQPPAAQSDPKGFADFWAVYPRRTGKGAARKAYAAAVRKVGAERVLAGARRLAGDPNLPDPQYVPHPATWLNQERWDDDPLPARGSAGPQSVAGSATRAFLDIARGAQRPAAPAVDSGLSALAAIAAGGQQ